MCTRFEFRAEEKRTLQLFAPAMRTCPSAVCISLVTVCQHLGAGVSTEAAVEEITFVSGATRRWQTTTP